MVRVVYTLLYIWITIIVVGCNGKTSPIFGGDREASLSILPVSKVFQLKYDDPKKLQMVIIADPTASMGSAKQAIRESLPGFTQGLLSTGFTFDIFCSNTSYTGATGEVIITINSSDNLSTTQLQAELTKCIDVDLTQKDFGDERGLESAKLTWERVGREGQLDPNAVKLTMIISNEDDCSRDLGKFPIDDANKCKDQNVTSSPVPMYLGQAFPITDLGYSEDSRLFTPTRYADFFKERLNYVTTTKADELDQALRQRGHIFAPVIMPPPVAIGQDKAKSCVDLKTRAAKQNGLVKVMSYGMRYFQVAEATGNPIYSLCDDFADIFSEIKTTVENEVNIKRFILSRRPADPTSLRIEIKRKIIDTESAGSILERMELENSRSSESNKWIVMTTKESKQGNLKIITQEWRRIISYGQEFSYNPQTNEIILDNNLYEAYNDKLQVMNYAPEGLDGEVNYDVNNTADKSNGN